MAEGSRAADDPAARVDAALADVMGEALLEQKLRQDRMRQAQEFLSSPAFVDLREAPMVVSDDAAALDARRRDLDYRIGVLGSVMALLVEDRAALDRAVPSDPASQP